MPRLRILFRSSPLMAALATVLLSACEGPTDGGDEPGVRLEVFAGQVQRGLPGQLVPEFLSVRAVGADGQPVQGVRVDFQAGAESGTVEAFNNLTNSQGVAVARWTLGPLQPQQSVTATVEGGAEAVTFTATFAHASEADLVLARDAGIGPVRLVAYPRGAYASVSVFEASFQDSLLVMPMSGDDFRTEIFALAPGRRPVLVSPVAWTQGRDTVVLDFQDPVVIPVTAWILKGSLPVMVDGVRTHLATAQALYDAAGMGIRFGEMDIRDMTGHVEAPNFANNPGAPCGTGVQQQIGQVPGRINIYYIGILGQYSGYGCAANTVMMAESSRLLPNLLTHEIGHTLGLQHTSDPANLMASTPNHGTNLYAGQVYHAHFGQASSLNAVYGAYPAELQRACPQIVATTATNPCLPPGWDFD